MFETIKKFFNDQMNLPETDDHPDPKKIAIATCALFLEMAHADSEFSDQEKTDIIDILKHQFDLSDEDADIMIRHAEKQRKDNLDLWQFTNLINQNYSRTDKLRVIETLWRIIYIDGKVDKHEEYLIRRLTNLLNLDHQDMISAKFAAREYQDNKG
jgi:uncharacterized tellurite resistance protein B-like protein